MLKTRAVLAHLLVPFILVLAGCSKQPALPEFDASSLPTKASRRVTLKEVQPIFSTKCAACHNPTGMDEGVPVGGLVLVNGASGPNLVNARSTESKLMRVHPGDLAKSYIFHKINGTFAAVGGTGMKMPLGGQLPPDEIALISDWILSGAPDE